MTRVLAAADDAMPLGKMTFNRTCSDLASRIMLIQLIRHVES